MSSGFKFRNWFALVGTPSITTSGSVLALIEEIPLIITSIFALPGDPELDEIVTPGAEPWMELRNETFGRLSNTSAVIVVFADTSLGLVELLL